MPARFVNIDHDTPLLLPPDLRDWVPEDHLVHFIMEAVGLLDLSTAHVNHRGTGSDQYPPSMMLGLLIYCYATGTFSSRRIERLTHENVAVRLLCADRHPDHDSICTFRRGNRRGGGGDKGGWWTGEPRCSKAAFTRCSKSRRASGCCAWAR